MPRYVNPHAIDAEFDALGRKEPRRLDLSLSLRACGWWHDETGMRFAERWRLVPARAVVESGDDEQGRYALLSCPCEARPVVRDLLAKCSGCERYYVIGKTGAVLVVYGDMDPPARAQK